MPDLISFTHPSVVDKILKIILLYIEQGQQLVLDPRPTIKCIIEKCLATEKADKEDIKKSCLELLLWYMENKFEEPLLNQLNDNLLNKNPKVNNAFTQITGASLTVMTTLLNNFGIKKIKP